MTTKPAVYPPSDGIVDRDEYRPKNAYVRILSRAPCAPRAAAHRSPHGREEGASACADGAPGQATGAARASNRGGVFPRERTARRGAACGTRPRANGVYVNARRDSASSRPPGRSRSIVEAGSNVGVRTRPTRARRILCPRQKPSRSWPTATPALPRRSRSPSLI